MSTWKSLIKTTTLGLNRTPLPGEKGEGWLEGIGEKEDSALNALEQAAAYGLARRVGWKPSVLAGRMPELAPAETNIYLGTQAANLVFQAISTNSAKLITEALELCITHDFLLPPEYLPTLFRQASQIAVAPETLLLAAGNRGPWLASQEEAWQHLLPLEASDWDTGDLSQRMKWFSLFRKKDLTESRKLFQEVIATEATATLLKFLPLMEQGLGSEDEALLIPLLGHRRKDVRVAVSGLLGKIATSAFVGRMKERLAELVELKETNGTPELAVVLPAINEELKADQIHEYGYAASGLGKRAGYLCAMLSMLPSSFWSQKWQKTPGELVTIAYECEWRDALILGWTYSAIVYRDEDWAMAILAKIIEMPALLDVIKDTELGQLVDCLGEEKREPFLFTYLKKAKTSSQQFPLFKILLISEFGLSEKLATTFISHLILTLQQKRIVSSYHFRSLLYADLPMLSLRVPVSSYAVIAKAFNNGHLTESWYQAPIDELLEILELRYQLHNVFHS